MIKPINHEQMEHLEKIPKLIANHLRGDISAAEKQELDAWIKESEANRLFFMEATNEQLLPGKIKQFLSIDMDTRLNNTLHALDPEASITSKGIFARMKKFTIAACFLVIAGAGIYYIMRDRVSGKKDLAKTTTNTNNNNDVQPGTEKAVLTLSDGTKITLDNTTNGTIAQQGNTVVLKEDGLLAYNTDRKKSQTEILYNTLTTPKGGEYRSLVLSDGTKVWLNSVSSIRYPAAFTGKERIVGITGEVYFEVTKNRAMPFKVAVNGMQLEVLGTHFNINSYEDEASIKTTLLEGAVKIVAGGKVSFLKPGQQASLNTGKELKVLNDVNLEETLAWKNGMFIYDGADIKTIMRQVSRWYDVDVVFEDNISGHFVVTGISRTMPVSKLFGVLEKMGGVHFEIDGKRILVKKH